MESRTLKIIIQSNIHCTVISQSDWQKKKSRKTEPLLKETSHVIFAWRVDISFVSPLGDMFLGINKNDFKHGTRMENRSSAPHFLSWNNSSILPPAGS